jgi:hypothetical protein
MGRDIEHSRAAANGEREDADDDEGQTGAASRSTNDQPQILSEAGEDLAPTDSAVADPRRPLNDVERPIVISKASFRSTLRVSRLDAGRDESLDPEADVDAKLVGDITIALTRDAGRYAENASQAVRLRVVRIAVTEALYSSQVAVDCRNWARPSRVSV